MEFVRVETTSRTETGKGAARKLRAAGQVPGVVYGRGQEPQAVVVAREVLDRVARLGTSALLDLEVDGKHPPEGTAAMLKAVARHPVTWAPVSVDFQWVSLQERIHVPVPVVLVGIPVGVKEQGGILEQMLHNVEVRCLPTQIPHDLQLDVAALSTGDSLHARELLLPEGVELLTDAEATVAIVAAPRVEAEKVPEAAEEVEGELAEGEEPETGEG
jgi:large subunit ribosomal protein L25